TALSRKHIVEVSTEKRHITIFGGKLTDCLNVGEELVTAVSTLGVPLGDGQPSWYGEGALDERRAWMSAASAHLAETTAARLWRCYGARAHAILEAIQRDPSLALPLYPGVDVLRAEAAYAGRNEYVETVEDFLRRRTHLAQQLSPA